MAENTTAAQHRIPMLKLDLNMVLAITICPTCNNGPGVVCMKTSTKDVDRYKLVHGARLNRAWNMHGLGTPFKIHRFYMAGSGEEWVEVMHSSRIDELAHLYREDGRLLKQPKPRRRRHGR